MNYEILNGETVINIIVADAEFMAANFPDGNYREQPDPPAPPAPPPEWAWFIDIGPFYDRFGAAKMAVLTSTDAGLKAILADLNIRKWVDLQRPDVAQALAYVGSVVPAVDAAMQASILTTPVAAIENLALRKLYFGG